MCQNYHYEDGCRKEDHFLILFVFCKCYHQIKFPFTSPKGKFVLTYVFKTNSTIVELMHHAPVAAAKNTNTAVFLPTNDAANSLRAAGNAFVPMQGLYRISLNLMRRKLKGFWKGGFRGNRRWGCLILSTVRRARRSCCLCGSGTGISTGLPCRIFSLVRRAL